jgi:signal transduction histidine kinase
VREAVVRIWIEEDTLEVQIEDEGSGFNPEGLFAAARSNGLPGMHERVLLLGGRLVIESAPGSGTQLLAELPLAGHTGWKIAEHFGRLGR